MAQATGQHLASLRPFLFVCVWLLAFVCCNNNFLLADNSYTQTNMCCCLSFSLCVCVCGLLFVGCRREWTNERTNLISKYQSAGGFFLLVLFVSSGLPLWKPITRRRQGPLIIVLLTVGIDYYHTTKCYSIRNIPLTAKKKEIKKWGDTVTCHPQAEVFK